PPRDSSIGTGPPLLHFTAGRADLELRNEVHGVGVEPILNDRADQVVCRWGRRLSPSATRTMSVHEPNRRRARRVGSEASTCRSETAWPTSSNARTVSTSSRTTASTPPPGENAVAGTRRVTVE